MQGTKIAEALGARGHDASMIVSDHGQRQCEQVRGIRVLTAYDPMIGLPGIRFFTPRLVGLLRQLVRSQADSFFMMGAGFQVGIVGIFAFFTRKKLFWMAASDMDLDVPSLRRYLRVFDRLVFRIGLYLTHTILVQTNHQHHMAARWLGRGAVELPPLGPPLQPRIAPRERERTVLWIGNFLPVKRPDLFLEIAHRRPAIFFSMIGGPAPFYEEYFTMISKRAAQIPNVTLRGRQPKSVTYDLLRRASLLVCTSDHEGFPNTFLEAWSVGTPIVSLFDPDSLLRECSAGFFVHDIDQMLETIDRLWSDANAWEEASRSGHDFYRASFDLNRAIDRYEGIFLS